MAKDTRLEYKDGSAITWLVARTLWHGHLDWPRANYQDDGCYKRIAFDGAMDDSQMLICGDSASILPTLASGSVDLIVTDPPYAWNFMGKEWDKALPSVAIWKECLRVLKPGAFAFVMSGPRMDCLSEMGRRLAEAGFETGFSPIFWAYASGFPKATNMGKAIDKRACRDELKAKLGRSPTKEEMKEAWEGFREVVGVKSFAREGTTPVTRMATTIMGGNKLETGQGTNVETTPATPEAKALDGSYAGAQWKPAIEIVIVAMKPKTTKTYIDQALLWHREREEVLRGLAIQLKDEYNIDEVEWEG